MGGVKENNDQKVYNNLTEQVNSNKPVKDKWTLYLILCCLVASAASFVFGFNIGSTNLPTPLIKDFFAHRYYPEYYVEKVAYESKREEYDQNLNRYNLNRERNEDLLKQLQTAKDNSNAQDLNKATMDLDRLDKEYQLTHNQTFAKYLNTTRDELDIEFKAVNQDKEELDDLKYKMDELTTFLWTITNCLFVIGGIIGAFTSKIVQDSLGRKKGILFHHLFTVTGAVLVFLAPYLNLPEFVIASRFVYGIQGGMSCGLIPTYLSEISPGSLRGATGVVHQLFITVGILVSQTLGFRQILGVASLWHYLLAIPIVPGVFGSLFLLLFFSETPRALLINNKDEQSARLALRRLRNSNNVDHEIEEMNKEARESSNSSEAISMKELFTIKELRWPLITGLILQLTQQLCGINAIFFYSESIFRNAGIESEHIQYAIFLTGLVNVIMTIVCVPLIDRLGRKPLLVYPMLLIIIDFIALTVFLMFQANDRLYSYLSIVAIIVFIMCFAIGLGPVPFIYVAESFRQDARSAALAICMFTNWVANLALTLAFPYLAKLLTNYVFLVFTAIVAFAVIVIFKKVPETKGKSTEEIMEHFNGKKKKPSDDAAASQKLIATTSA